MPVLETVAGIIAIIQISERVIKACKFYLDAAAGTPSDLQAILVEVSTLKAVLETLQFLQSCPHSVPALWDQLLGQDGPLELCEHLILDLEGIFPNEAMTVAGSLSRSKRPKVQLLRTSLAWPLKAGRARKLLQTITQQKMTIILALSADSSQEIKSIKKDTSEIRLKLTNLEQREVYQWFEKTDPTPIHNRSWKLHEEETSDWILRSPDWNKWLAGDVRCLWIHGIPGAGKTILASFLVEQLKTHCKDRMKTGYAYYYCYFGHNQDETSPFLSWIIARLCRQANSVPDLVYDLFKNAGEPSLTELLLALEVSLQYFDVTYVIIDAVDESQPRGDLLRVLRDLATDARFSRIHCLVTSREYIDIEDSLGPISQSLSMSNSVIEDDIRKHVRSILRSKPRFRHWHADLQMEVEEKLASESRGMFRWAVCQLDSLHRLKGDRLLIRNALATLPRTLYETYDRIFDAIPLEEQAFARHALRWVCFHQDLYGDAPQMSLPLLLITTERSTCLEYPDEINLVYDEQRLRDMLGCLITVEEDRSVRLAHYTVEEYLRSSSASESVVGPFKNKHEAITFDYMQIVLQEAQTFRWSGETETVLHNHDTANSSDISFQNFALYCVSTGLWLLQTREEIIASNECLLALAVDLVSPDSAHVGDFARTIDTFFDGEISTSYLIGDRYLPIWKTVPDCIDAGILLFFLTKCQHQNAGALAHMFIEGKNIDFIATSHVSFQWLPGEWVDKDCTRGFAYDGSLLEVMAQMSWLYLRPFMWLLNQCCSAVNTGVLLAVVAVHYCTYLPEYYKDCALKKLLWVGCNVNAADYAATPLQIAAATCDSTAVAELLEAGAAANMIGNQNGVLFKTNSILAWANELRGSSPLYICRKFKTPRRIPGPLSLRTSDELQGKRLRIEALLLEHGAEEFHSPV